MKKHLFFFLILFLLLGCAENTEIFYEVDAQEADNMYDVNDNNKLDDPDHPIINDLPVSITETDEEIIYSCENPDQFNLFNNKIHVIYMAESEDGIHWQNEQFIIHGSVPEVVYFNNKYYLFAAGGCLMWESDDGITFEPYTYSIGKESMGEEGMKSLGVDPSVINDNGLLRLFFYEPQHDGQPMDPALIEGEHPFTEYTSEDAITWTRVGEIFAVEQGTDPDVVIYNDVYYMFISHGTSVMGATSQDGVNFIAISNNANLHNEGGVPDTIVVDNTLHMYAHIHQGQDTIIRLLTSTDGINWNYETDVIEDGMAPSVLQLPSGSFRMYYVKSISEEEYEAFIS
jgi:hypothetical protein